MKLSKNVHSILMWALLPKRGESARPRTEPSRLAGILTVLTAKSYDGLSESS